MKSAAIIALCFVFLGGSLASFISFYTFDLRLSRFDAIVGKSIEFEGTVTDVVWDGGYNGIYIIDVERCEDLPSFSCVVTAGGGISENSFVRGTARFSHLESNEDFDERRYYLSKGVILSGEAESLLYLRDGGFSLRNIAGRLQDFLSGILLENLGEEEGSFASALLLGDKSGLSETLTRDFQRLGLSHVLAISGMHLTVLCAFVSMLLSPLGKNAGRIGSILTVVFYVFITGLAPSVTRSAIMLLALYLAAFLHRGSDRFTNLGIAAFLICIIDPFACADIGLQLSFAAVLSILLFTTKRTDLTEKSKDKKNVTPLSFLKNATFSLLKSALITVIVVLFMIPLEWLYFGQISVVSPLTSPVFSLLTTLLLWALPLLLILSPAPTFAAFLAFPIKKLILFIYTLSSRISLLRGITVSLSYPFAFLFCILIVAAVVAFCVTKKKKRLIAGGVALVLVLAFALSCVAYKLPDSGRAEITMLEHKKSDGIILASDSKVMLIDIGNGYSGVYKKCVSKLSSLQATEIEAVMLTHLHTSHTYTLSEFFSEQMVRTLLIPKEDSDIFYDILDVCEENNVKAVPYAHGDTVKFEDCEIDTVPHKYYKRSTQPVVALGIRAFGETFAYLGGAYFEEAPLPDLSDTSCVWFGTHGPLYKNSFDPALPDSCTVFAGESAKEYLDEKYSSKEPDSVILE